MVSTPYRRPNRRQMIANRTKFESEWIWKNHRGATILVPLGLLLWQLVITPLIFHLSGNGKEGAGFAWWALYDPTVNTYQYSFHIVMAQLLGLMVALLLTSIGVLIAVIFEDR